MMQALVSLWPASIPSPGQGVWWIGPIPLRAYGLIIVTGMMVAVFISRKRYAQRGGDGEMLFDLALWVLPMGIVGARIYHVFANSHYYFASAERMAEIPRIWEGGLAIWGGIMAGALTAVIVVKHRHQRVAPLADAIAPTIILAQGIGRWGNYFNQELFGSPTTMPWGLEIDAAHLPAGYEPGTLFHPTFLYESVWNIAAFFVIIALDKRFSFKGGQVMCLYLMAYSPIRIYTETLRLDPAYEFFGIRQNALTSILALIIAVVAFVYLGRHGGSSELTPEERERALHAISQREVASKGTEKSADEGAGQTSSAASQGSIEDVDDDSLSEESQLLDEDSGVEPTPQGTQSEREQR